MATSNVNGNKGLSANLLPKFYQTPANKKFLQSTIDQLFQPGSLTKISGYVGKENSKASVGTDLYIEASDKARQDYQLEPGVTIKDTLGNVTFFKDYIDYINQINVFGGNTENHARLNKQEFYSWNPHIDWDKFVNFQNYYWLPYGPDTITIYGRERVISSAYTVEVQRLGTNNQFVFTPDGLTPNPVLRLYRGKTYTFNINSPGNPFSFKTVRSAGAADRYNYQGSVSANGVTSGTITFTVTKQTPSILYYQSENDIDLGGAIQISELLENTSIDVEKEILGKKTATLDNGIVLRNGMKLAFGGIVYPESYANGQFYVEGVGSAIKLISVDILEIVSPYSTTNTLPFDSMPWDVEPFDDATGYAGTVDYITINRSSQDHNPWSRYNRWFHKDVVSVSSEFNNNTISLDQTTRAIRPIIEFLPDIKLHNLGTTAIPDIDLIDTFTQDAFSTIEGTIGYNIDNFDLLPGMRVIFTADPDPLVQNKIYKVEYVDVEHLNGGSNQLHLVEISTPEAGQVVLVRQGLKYQSKMFWFNGTTWVEGQTKTAANQAPLFDMFDNDGVSFSNLSVYTGSTFVGTKIFSYKLGTTGTVDPKLGFILSYQNVNNIGDIVFNFNLATDTFEYKKTSIVEKQNINVGYLSTRDYGGNLIYSNGWEISNVTNVQAAVRIYKNSGRTNNFSIDIFDDSNNLSDLVVKIYVNGIRLDSKLWSITSTSAYKIVVLATPIGLDDVLTIRAFSAQIINQNGYYEIPLNLQNNPLNDVVTNFTLGEVADHVNSILDNLPTADTDIQNLGNITPYGTKFVQHSGPLSLGVYHICSESNNVIKALEQARTDYNSFKQNFISTASSLGVDGDPVTLFEMVLNKLNNNKPRVAPYYLSDMVPYGAAISTSIKVVDYRIKNYPLTDVFSLDKLSNKAVGIYLNGIQLVYGQDYNFNVSGFVSIDPSVNLANGNTIRTVEYENTDGSFVPATPTKLGMWPASVPKKYLDTTLVNPQMVIQGHDGSIVLAYNDYRDNLILELEKRIFNNIKVKYDTSIFDISKIIPSYNRKSDYSRTEFNSVLAPNFYKWTGLVGKDLTTPLNYDRTNSFTYNYALSGAPDKTPVPAYWRGIYRYILDTDRPQLCPWEMLGFTIEPKWWTTVYGPSPYTSDNLVMWQDIADGAVREPNTPPAYFPDYAKPFLMSHIPVDNFGNLISPLQSGIASGLSQPSINNNFVFGDGSPVESAWTRSSYYPFSVIVASLLLTPANTFGMLLDRSRVVRNVAGQLIYSETGLRLKPSDVLLPSTYSSSTRVQTAGLVNYIVDLIFNYIFSNNIAGYNSYATDLSTLTTLLSYRVGAYTNKPQFNLLLESKTPSSTGNVFVPPDDYSVFLNKSTPVKKITYSGVVITKVSTGFEIKGYSLSQPYFKYYQFLGSGSRITVGGISEDYSAWTPGENYIVGSVVQYNGSYYRSTQNSVADETFNTFNFAKLAGLPMNGGSSANIRNKWDSNQVLVAPYGTLFPDIQSVVDFLLGYGEYLKDQGFLFNDYNKNYGTVSNWLSSANEFLFWTTQNWSTGVDKWQDWQANQSYTYGSIVKYDGDFYSALYNIPLSNAFDSSKWNMLPGLSNIGSSVISLSPSANGINFTTTLTVVDSIASQFNPYEIFKVDGSPFALTSLDSYHQDGKIAYIPKSVDGIYGASFYLVQHEHVVIVNNTTIFNDIIYSPTSGYRRDRLKVSGYVTTGWTGGLDIPGFIFDAAKIADWQPWKDYNVGDIVKYGQFYLQAEPTSGNLIPGSEKFDYKQWAKLLNKPTNQILPNWTTIASQFTDFYSADVDSFDTAQQSMAHHLIGYQKRQYLNNIIQDPVSEFKFYQGMIREKGTQNVLNQLFGVLNSENKESLTFYEEWAIRTGRYGATNSFEEIEFILDESKYLNNPQATTLVTNFDSKLNPFVVQQTINDIYVKPLGYTSTPFPVFEPKKSNQFLRSAGYVNSADVYVAISSTNQLLGQVVTSITVGLTYIIKSAGTTDFTQIGATTTTVGQSFVATGVGSGTGTVVLDPNKLNEGSYIWCAFDPAGWNVYRYTDIQIRATNATYANNLLTITTDVTSDIAVGSFIGLSQIPTLSGFYQVTSVVLNKITVSATIAAFPNLSALQIAEIIIFGLIPQRTSSIDDIDSILPTNLQKNDLVWTDNSGAGSWATWIYDPVFQQQLLNNPVPSANSQFGYVTSINKQGNLLAVGSLSGNVVIYDKVGLQTPWIRRQEIIFPFSAQTDFNALTLVASTIAISPDGTWIATGSPRAGHISTKLKSNWSLSNTYQVGDIVSLGIGSVYQATLAVPTNIPVTNTYYWRNIPFIPVDELGTNSSLMQQGMVSLYKKDVNNLYSLVDSIISPAPADGQSFGETLEFGNSVLYIGATGNGGSVFKLSYSSTPNVATSYDNVGSTGTTLKVTSAIGITAGMYVQSSAFLNSQVVNSVLSRIVFPVSVSGNITNSLGILIKVENISAGMLVTGTGVVADAEIYSKGITSAGNVYIIVSASQNILTSITQIQLDNDPSLIFAVSSVASANTLILSGSPTSTPVGILNFVTTSWAYNNFVTTPIGVSYFGTNLSLSDDNNTLAVSSNDSVYLYATTSATLIHTYTGFTNTSDLGVSISGSGKYLAIGQGSTGTVGIYQTASLTPNVPVQTLINHFTQEDRAFFGSKLAFMSDDTLVVYSQSGSTSISTTLDAYSETLLSYTHVDENGVTQVSTYVNDPASAENNQTTFDNQSTRFVTPLPNAGRVDIYDRYATKWVYSESLDNIDTPASGYGVGFAVGNNSVVVGLPRLDSGSLIDTGKAYVYNKSPNNFTWKIYRSQIPVVNIGKIKKAFLYDRVTSKLLVQLDVIDPNQGKIPGPADEEIKYKSFYDPATYFYSNLVPSEQTVNTDAGSYWASPQVGQLWWDLRTAKFIDPYFEDISYRNNAWNKLAQGASIDIYEWVSSSLLPAAWDAVADTPAGLANSISGSSLYGNSAYSVTKSYNSITKKFINTYYYWVKNKAIVPAVEGRRLSAQSVSSLISNPRGNAYTYIALIGKDSFSIANISQYLNSTDTVLAIEYWTIDKVDQNVHSQWKLISKDTAVEIPDAIQQKWVDSLCGADEAGRPVPDINLPPKLKYGIENRPRQSMFINRTEALKEFVEAVNTIFLKYQITENYNIQSLELYDTQPTSLSGKFDLILDTDAELPYANINLFQPASLTPVIVDGRVTGIKIFATGKGYIIPPYIEIAGSGKGAVAKAIINSVGNIVSATIVSSGEGYNPDVTVCSVRSYSVLVKNDSLANGNWSIYSYDSANNLWSRSLTQSFDVRNYWSKVDWYSTGYNQFSSPDFVVHTTFDLNLIDVSIGQLVKVLKVNSGNWVLIEKIANINTTDWTRNYTIVGIQGGTIQLSSSLYQTEFSAVGYDSSTFDQGAFDVKASTELRIILKTLKDNIFVGTDLKGTYLDLFLRSVRYAHSEQLYIDWIFKTSFVRATHHVGKLDQPVYYPIDNLSNFEDYVAEVKPYRTKIREYISQYTSLDPSYSAVTDFDLPSVVKNSSALAINTAVTGNVITADQPEIQSYPWKFWLDNTGYSITELIIVNGGSGYVTTPQVTITSDSGSGATAEAYFTNGIINRIILQTPGSGYLSAPTVSINSGLSATGTPAKVIAIIGKGVVRSNLIGMKFDRTDRKQYIVNLNVTDSFVGTGSKKQFVLTWAPDIKVGKSSVYIDDILVLRETYTLAIETKIVNSQTQYYGTLTFIVSDLAIAPALNSTIVINYIKDISLLNAVDRIEFYYNPTTGMLGKELSQLMTGVDYGGNIVGNLGFVSKNGWGAVPYALDKWDTYDNTYTDYVIQATAGTHALPYAVDFTPVVGTNINVYHIKNYVISAASDGVSLVWPFNLFITQPAVSVTTTVNSISLSNVSSTLVNYSTNIQSTLTSTNGTAGQSSIVFDAVPNVVVGQYVSGIGVVAGSKVIQVAGTIVIISNNLTLDATGNYNFYLLGTVLTVSSLTGIVAGMGVSGAGFSTQSVTKTQTVVVSGVTLRYVYINAAPNSIPTISSTLAFVTNSAGSKQLTVASTANLKVGDVVTCALQNVFGYNATIVSIENSTKLTLSQIIYSTLANNTSLLFTRVLSQPAEVVYYANGTILLSDPVLVGSYINIYGKLDPIRIDDPAYPVGYPVSWSASISYSVGATVIFNNIKYVCKITHPAVSQFSASLSAGNWREYNDNAVIVTPVLGTTPAPLVLTTVKSDGSRSYTINIPNTYVVNNDDVFILRQSTSDGTIVPTDYDTDISGGDLAYSTARGILADDIVLDGDAFVSETTSPAPEEVVPGQVVDTLAIKVFDRSSSGSANIAIDNYITDGIATTFDLRTIPVSTGSIILKIGNAIKTINSDYTIDYENKLLVLPTAPAAKQILTIFAIGFSGSNILDLDYFVGDGTTTEFVTKSPWLDSFTGLVYVNGIVENPVFFKTDNTYEINNSVGIRFDMPVATDALINYIIVSGNTRTFSVTNSEIIPTAGNTTYTLQNLVGRSLPNETNMIVRANQTILNAPVNSYFTIKSNIYSYQLDANRVTPYTISAQDVIVIANNILLVPGTDYSVDLAGVTVQLTRSAYSKYKNTKLTISITTNAGYFYNPTNNQITFTQAYTSSDVVEVTSSFNHDTLDVERTTLMVKSAASLTPETVQYYQYQSIIGGLITLDRAVLNESYVWVVKNSTLLVHGVDYKLLDDHLSIQLTNSLSLTDKISLMTFGSNVITAGISYMQFKDMLNRTIYKRLSLTKRTELATDLRWNSTSIVLVDGSNFEEPDTVRNAPGVIEIRGERIEYFAKTGNVLSKLRRGTSGTGVFDLNYAGIFVQDIGSGETIPYNDAVQTTQILSNGTNTVKLSFAPTKGNQDSVNINYDPTGVRTWFSDAGYLLIGAFDPASSYKLNDVVVYNNSYYYCSKTVSLLASRTLGVDYTPANSIYWTLYPTGIPVGYGQTNQIEVFVGGYDDITVWTPNTIYNELDVVNVGNYTYRRKPGPAHTSKDTFANDNTNWSFFIGNIRLQKQPYKVFNINQAPYSPAGDVTFDADFSVNGVSNELRLTNKLAIGTTITVVKRTLELWDSSTNIMHDDSKIASFIKAAPGVWYTQYQLNTEVPVPVSVESSSFDSASTRFDGANLTFDQG